MPEPHLTAREIVAISDHIKALEDRLAAAEAAFDAILHESKLHRVHKIAAAFLAAGGDPDA